MAKSRKNFIAGTATVIFFFSLISLALAWTPLTVKQDPLVFLPGSQPGDVQGMDSIGRCENCHSGYNPAVEPGSNWRGSMMAQAARDPLWLACLTVAAQDSIWAVGNPNATDMCIRCHSPGGWLESRSDPTNISLLAGNDLEGVHCDYCHRSQDPFTTLGQPDVDAEDSGSLGASMAADAHNQALTDLSTLKLFDGAAPLLDSITKLPWYYGPGMLPHYFEGGGGQFYVAQSSGAKWGPRPDTAARHQVQYSRFHKSREFCHTCHDVSNAVLQNLVVGEGTASGTEQFAAASFFHIERTSSEFLLSDYGRGDGAATKDIPGVAWAAKCQDCHMRAISGKAADKNNVALRDDMAFHDLTGGNAWMNSILASVDPGYSGYDQYNYDILSGSKYPGASIDVAGLSGSGELLARGRQRALEQLQMAATLVPLEEEAEHVTIRIHNNTGHKLISGFPEGRRMFLNIEFQDGNGDFLSGINQYEPLVTSTDGSGTEVYVSGGTLIDPVDQLVFETKLSTTLTGEDGPSTFHVALADNRYKDNRIPPKGFDINGADERLAQPRWHGADDPDYFTAEEYDGGYHDVTVSRPAEAAGYTATLYYQTTSKKYIAFLRDQINGSGNLTLPSPTPSGETNAYVAQSDPFFSNLKGWGNAIWDLWLHNGGSAPVAMATINGELEPREEILVDPPTQVSAFYDKQAATVYITWLPPATGANGYHIYISTAPEGPFELRATVGETPFADTGFLAAGSYWYMVKTFRVDKLGEEYTSEASSLADATLDTPIGNQPPIFLSEPRWAEGSWTKLSSDPENPHAPQSQHVLFFSYDDDGVGCQIAPTLHWMYRPVELQEGGSVLPLGDWIIEVPSWRYMYWVLIEEPTIADTTGPGLFEFKMSATDCLEQTTDSEGFYGKRYYFQVE